MTTSIRLLSAAVLLALAACASTRPTVIYTAPPEPALPAPPVLVPVPAAALDCPPDVSKNHPGMMCLSAHTYSTLVRRERALRNYGVLLRSAIDEAFRKHAKESGGG